MERTVRPRPTTHRWWAVLGGCLLNPWWSAREEQPSIKKLVAIKDECIFSKYFCFLCATMSPLSKTHQVKKRRENCNGIDLSSNNIVNFRWDECVVAESLRLYFYISEVVAQTPAEWKQSKATSWSVEWCRTNTQKSICLFYPNCLFRDKQLPPVDF